MAINPELLVPSPFPAIGPLLTLSQGVPGSQVRRVIRITTFSSLLIRLGAYVLGTAVLQFFGISVSTFQIAGGLLLGFSVLSLFNATDPGDPHEKNFDLSHMDVGQITLRV